MLYEFNLHFKTIAAYVFHAEYLSTHYSVLQEDYEVLYHKALVNVLHRAYQIMKETGQDRITVKLNEETTRILYHRADMAVSEYVNLKDIMTFPTYEDGIAELEQDLEYIMKQCESRISLRYRQDPRLLALRKEISRGCKIVMNTDMQKEN